jgi:flagellar protein FliS
MKDPQTQYRETQILTASPAKLLIMLYDAAIVAIETAIAELEAKSLHYDIVNNNLLKAQEIVSELIVGLDSSKAPEIVRNLEALYNYFIKRLMEGNIRKEIPPLKEVLGHLKELRQAWQIACEKVQEEETRMKSPESVTPPSSTSRPSPKKSGGLNIKG